jgi:hypothetical protein
MGGTVALPSRIPASEAARQRAFAGLYRAPDRLQPGAGNTTDRQLYQGRTGRAQALAAPRFQRCYTLTDVELLASVDDAHERLSGSVTRHILKRKFEVCGKPEFERLAALSNGHLCNLRQLPPALGPGRSPDRRQGP